MINDLAIDNVFNNFACDGSEGDRSVVSRIMPTVLLVYWCNMCLFPWWWNFPLMQCRVKQKCEDWRQFSCSFLQKSARDVVWAGGFVMVYVL